MQLLANENLPAVAVNALRSAGHDVAWVHVDAPGCSDIDVLTRANAENRVLSTFDKDFGELAFRHGMGAKFGVVLLRLTAESPSLIAAATVKALSERSDRSGHFSVIDENRIRMTPLRRTSPPRA